MKQSLRNILAGSIALAIATVALAGKPVEIRLQDGSRWTGELKDTIQLTYRQRGVEILATGTLVKLAEHYITVETDVAGEIRLKTIFRNDLLKIRTLTDGGAYEVKRSSRVTAGLTDVGYEQAKDRERSTPGIFVLPLSGMVGVDFRHEEIERIAEEADKYGSGQIIVLLIDSGGGLVTEMEQIHATLTEIKKRHRLVAWIKQAISAACATAVHCHEIYFMKHGTAGAMTAFSGSTPSDIESLSGRQLERWLEMAGDWMESGGRSRYIAESMIHAPNMLSYDKDPVTGQVTFYNDLSGETVLSRPGENLVFTASNALDSGFSDGTANNEQELAELLDLPEWYETSNYGRKIAKQWQDTVELAKRELPLLKRRLEYAGTGSGDPVEILGTRIKIFEKFMRWHERCPNCTMIAGLPPKDQLKREITEMRRQLAKLKRR